MAPDINHALANGISNYNILKYILFLFYLKSYTSADSLILTTASTSLNR